MEFSLTDELIEQIISAMENQEQAFVVNAESGLLVEKNVSVKADDDTYYELPEWNPSDGYALREGFVSQLHIPQVRGELKNVLHSGRGVFKNFRNVLKNYPDVDKRWHIFKYKFMSARITEWYNSLREVWGLEKLDYFSETDDDLVHDDFSFDDYTPSENQEEILANAGAFLTGDEWNIPAGLKEAIYDCAETQFSKYDSQIGFICRSQVEEFAGCITASVMTESQEETMILTSFFVPESFRGLGIGTELLTMLLKKLKDYGKKTIFLPNLMIPEFLEPLLIRTGFRKIRNGFFAEI